MQNIRSKLCPAKKILGFDKRFTKITFYASDDVQECAKKALCEKHIFMISEFHSNLHFLKKKKE